jgi:hypothetical protein
VSCPGCQINNSKNRKNYDLMLSLTPELSHHWLIVAVLSPEVPNLQQFQIPVSSGVAVSRKIGDIWTVLDIHPNNSAPEQTIITAKTPSQRVSRAIISSLYCTNYDATPRPCMDIQTKAAQSVQKVSSPVHPSTPALQTLPPVHHIHHCRSS